MSERSWHPRSEPGPTVAVVGRPNVGKSTLVNRFVGRRAAIVQEQPGVTRDRTTHAAEWQGHEFTVIDTGGWTPEWSPDRGRLDAAVSAQAQQASAIADVALLVVDATVGATAEDAAVARWLRASGRPVLLVANKADALSRSALPAELAALHALGLGDPHPVSALHGTGSGDLLDAVVAALSAAGALGTGVARDPDVPGIALIGRPNVGKSSLFNRLLGTERVLVDAAPGTTRDAVDTVVELDDGRAYRFVDTAGLRRKRASVDTTEYFSTVRTRRALERAALALLVVDASEPIAEQEQRLAREVLDAGRGLVLVLNKWDLVDADRRQWVARERDRLLDFVAFAPVLRTSALTGRAVGKLFEQVDGVLEQWGRRIPTAQLNSWLAETVAAAAPPMAAHRPVRLRYVTQVASGPPTFLVFTNGRLPRAYLRFLERRLRERFGFRGTPLRLVVRQRAGWEERGRDGQDRDGQDRDGQDRDGQDRDGQDRDQQDRDGQDRGGPGRAQRGRDGRGRDEQGRDQQDREGRGRGGTGRRAARPNRSRRRRSS